ncbi:MULTISPECIES: TonB-dependent siderophore receptor [unclassified Sphingobium]|uniref:TonB-dependent siderophore receptor n=1 Tax=unclassified Sphingobium TaxID=2611147 RepID=UPI0007701439|nr:MULTISPECIES: TonB-dependent siderophore receptor [unclassified Sphingobium]AMK23851.1 TonB-dependent siderophore receptor [Sphingobium sp. TKS]NML89612.1 TonB-dependent siderophore receptor [Sphingobium sp. TB-6]
MRKNSAFRLALTASAAAIAFAPGVQAQTAATTEIVVTAMKRQYFGDTPVKEIPQAVQFLEGKLLDDLNITRLDTALELASGVSKQNNFGGLWDSFAIRGFAGDENFPSGFLVNGFNGGRGYGGPRDASNVERIEVLKGPNSALFGRGEPGGTINIVTKKPVLEKTFGSFGIAGGSWNNYRVEGDFNLPINDMFAVRLNGAAEDADSFRDTVHTRKYVLTPSFLAKFSDKDLFTYEMEYVNQEVPFERGVVAIPTVQSNGSISYNLGAIPNSRFLGNPNDGPTKVKVLGHQAQYQHDFSDDWTLMLGAGYKDTIFRGFSSDPELVLSRQRLDNDGMTLSRQRRYRDYSTSHMVFRGEISGKIETGSIVHNIRIGGDWDRFKIDTYQTRYRPSAADQSYSINIFNPNYNIPAPTPTTVIQNSTEIQKAWGIYAQDQVEITEQFKVRFGGRYDDFAQDIDLRVNNTNPKKSYTKFSPMAGLVFEPTSSISLYASYGKGFRPNSGVGFDGNPFDPEISKSYEVGGKFVTPDGKITSTISLYKMKKSNVLTTDPVNAGFSKPVGSAESKGVEFDLNAKLPAGFELFLTYAYTDAGWATNALDPNFSQPIRKGDPLINIPKHQANALLFKNFSIGNHEAMLGAGVNYVGRRLGETATTFFLPSYTLVKVIGSFNITDQIKLSADVNNLFDKKYYASSYAALWVQPGAPRSFTVRATFDF